MRPSVKQVLDYGYENADAVTDLLARLIRFRSTPGNEGQAQRFLARQFAKLGLEVVEEEVPEEIRSDPEYSHSQVTSPYKGRPNLIVRWGASRESGRSLIVNTHIDVVPAPAWPDAFHPKVAGGRVIGRGAVDCKGHIASMYLLFMMLNHFGTRLQGELLGQVVVEEEVGGNGTLSLIRKGYLADAAVVLEASEMTVCPANRGAVWFRATVRGRSVHMARKFEGVSAIDKSIQLIRLLYEYEEELTRESQGQELFSEYKHPVQVNIGRMVAGDWPSTVPETAVLEGGVGFLPNRDLESIKKDLRGLPSKGDSWLSQHTEIEFPALHNDSYQIPPDHPLVETLVSSCQAIGLETRVRGLIASCDARLFNKLAEIPTVVFGAGKMEYAHSNSESVKVEDLVLESCTLYELTRRWCGATDG